MADWRVLVGVTGSVAAVKAPLIVRGLQAAGASVRVVLTEHAQHFVDAGELRALVGADNVFTDADEWRSWRTMGDPVLHIELRRWATQFAVAPLDANTLAKLAGGLCDNLLACVARAWDVQAGTMLVAPAMNTLMWTHPVTHTQLDTLRRWGVHVLPPVSKTLACGDVGVGALTAPEDIVRALASMRAPAPAVPEAPA